MAHDHVSEDEGYAAIIKSMDADLKRSSREREVERVMPQGGSIPQILSALQSECDSKAEMVRVINQHLREHHSGDGEPAELSRNTLYSWLDKYDVG